MPVCRFYAKGPNSHFYTAEAVECAAVKNDPGWTFEGIAYYDVYRSTNRGAYKRIKRTPSTFLNVRMRAGSRYRFYTIAVDKAGNRRAIRRKVR